MDKAILGLTAQEIREVFTICGIEDSEEHLNLVIAHAADHVYKARLVIAGGATEPISQAKEAIIETPSTPPHETRGSYRLMKQTGKDVPTTYSDMASTEKKKKKKRKRSDKSELIDQPPGASVADGTGTAKDKAPEESISPEIQTTVYYFVFQIEGSLMDTWFMSSPKSTTPNLRVCRIPVTALCHYT